MSLVRVDRGVVVVDRVLSQINLMQCHAIKHGIETYHILGAWRRRDGRHDGRNGGLDLVRQHCEVVRDLFSREGAAPEFNSDFVVI